MKAGDWCHVELPITDLERSKRFYGEIFGWQFMTHGDYTLYSTPGGREGVGGGLFHPPPGVPRAIVDYVLVDEIEPVVAKVEARGGRLINPKMEVHGAGWFALVADPDGNVFGIWKSASSTPPPKAKAKPAKKKAKRK